MKEEAGFVVIWVLGYSFLTALLRSIGVPWRQIEIGAILWGGLGACIYVAFLR